MRSTASRNPIIVYESRAIYDETVTFYLKAESNELLKFKSDLAIWEGDAQDKVFVDSEVIYGIANLPGNNGETRIKITVKFLEAVTLTSGKDLTIEITAADTSGNYSIILEVTPSQNN